MDWEVYYELVQVNKCDLLVYPVCDDNFKDVFMDVLLEMWIADLDPEIAYVEDLAVLYLDFEDGGTLEIYFEKK